MTINDVYRRRVEAIRKDGQAPRELVVTAQERHDLAMELKLKRLDEIVAISNAFTPNYFNWGEFELFGIKIVTEQELRNG